MPKLPSLQSWTSEYGVQVVFKKEKIFPRPGSIHCVLTFGHHSLAWTTMSHESGRDTMVCFLCVSPNLQNRCSLDGLHSGLSSGGTKPQTLAHGSAFPVDGIPINQATDSNPTTGSRGIIGRSSYFVSL